MFYFFFPTAQQELGTRGTLRVLGVSTATAIVLALALQFVGALHGGSVFLGIHAQLAALLVIFGLTRPSATILLFFVLPIRASIVAWGTGLLSFLFLITRRDLGSAVAFCAWLGAVAEIAGRPRLTVAWLRWRLRRSSPRPGSSARFHVIDGGRKQDPPVFH
jgi:membrane associated rhomboid family serine protease